MNWSQYWIAVAVGTALHEAAHIATARFYGLKVKQIGVTWRGVYLRREKGTPKQNVSIALAGPAANFILFALAYRFHTFAYVNLWFGIFNLLPFIPVSDGSKIVRYLRVQN